MKMLLSAGLVTGSKGKSRENQTNALKITCMKHINQKPGM
jgi:hypothetical protein